jgi:hypothetical protein
MVPTPPTFSVQSLQRILDANAKVAELIDAESYGWNRSLISSIFTKEESQAILNIPLSPILLMDKLIWRGTTIGVFTVRNAYHLGKQLQDNIGGQSSGAMKENGMWRTIWALDVPHVVKMFSWQACNDLLPTRSNLCKKRVTDDGKCPVCLVEDETTCHVLWKCPATRDVWGGDASLFQKCAWEGCKFMHLFEYCSH